MALSQPWLTYSTTPSLLPPSPVNELGFFLQTKVMVPPSYTTIKRTPRSTHLSALRNIGCTSMCPSLTCFHFPKTVDGCLNIKHSVCMMLPRQAPRSHLLCITVVSNQDKLKARSKSMTFRNDGILFIRKLPLEQIINV